MAARKHWRTEQSFFSFLCEVVGVFVLAAVTAVGVCALYGMGTVHFVFN